MMVHGHLGAATDGALFLQSFLNSAGAVKKPEMRMPLPPNLVHNSQLGHGQGYPVSMMKQHQQLSNGSGSGFLYNLLTSSDSQAVQRRSAFLGPSSQPIPQEFPRRSYSMSIHRAQNHLSPQNNSFDHRPSSVPRGVKRMHNGMPYPYANSSGRVTPVSPSTTFSSEEPLDLTCIRMPHEPISDSDSNSSESYQPLLRNILSRVPQLHPAPVQQDPRKASENEPVQLAKKTALVAHSHVSDWLKKGSDLIQTNNTLFGTLDKTIQINLLSRAWPRILQLYMAENNFHFTVSAIHDSQSGQDGNGVGLPTRKFSENLQKIISFAATLPFDSMTYNLLRLAAIFKADPIREQNLDEVQEEIMKHVKKHLEMKGFGKHYPQAEALLNAVTDTDKHMLETLFCKNLLPSSVDEFIRAKLGAV